MATLSNRSDFRKVFLVLGLGVIGFFSTFVILGLFYFRSEIRNQILQRDGIHLTSVANFLNARLPDEEPPELKLLHLALETSEIDRIIAVRVFDSTGAFLQGVPDSLYEDTVPRTDLQKLASGNPVVRCFPQYPQYALFNDFDSELSGSVPLVEVISPIMSDSVSPIGFIQFWSDGHSISIEFGQLDQKLAATGFLLISGGGIIFLILFTFARRRLLSLASLLAKRNQSLEVANAELARAARTSAIGSVASHLFHGLKNPLAGLKTYLKVTGRDEEAMAITDRMQSLIDESLSVIRDQEDNATNGALSMSEFRDTILSRLKELVANDKFTLTVNITGEGQIRVQKVQLLLLIIRNLVENAFDASPTGATVHIRLIQSAASFSIEIEDDGPGIPESIQTKLFEPVQSAKSGGTGIGLAISSVIARHIPAQLELKSSTPAGTVFLITLSS